METGKGVDGSAGAGGAADGGEVRPSLPPQFNFVISTDSMTAYMRVVIADRDRKLEKAEVMSAIAQKGITYGIDEQAVDEFLAEANPFKELRVASGLRPVKGTNGEVTCHFRTNMTGMPKERADGTVDFKDLDIVQNVSEGDVLCTVTPPGSGTDGVDVFGNPVKAQRGDPPKLPGGSDIRLSEDSLTVLAAANGGIHFKNNIITIEAVLVIKENVGVETGNIDYNGSVLVYGNVNEGYSVKAKEDITVNGIVEGAVISAGGNILIRNGINGMGKADIYASGDVSSVFVENAKVRCGGSIYSNAVMNSDISAGNSVVLRGRRGALLGGRCRAGEVVNVRTLGSEKNIRQEVVIDPLWHEYEMMGRDEPRENPELRIEKLIAKRDRILEQAEKVSGETKRLQREPKGYEEPLSKDEKQRQMREIILKKSKFTAEVAEINNEIRQIEELFKGRDFKVICTGQAFPGTRIDIGGVKYKVTATISNQKFCLDHGEIGLAAILPHEADVSN